mmetsp:Transcript_78514/g.209792  ORF Transcript_78514/g.209792 Transcript_78514/m.209792 type:complete len:93 (+) Transcript_78514:36-314(+)
MAMYPAQSLPLTASYTTVQQYQQSAVANGQTVCYYSQPDLSVLMAPPSDSTPVPTWQPALATSGTISLQSSYPTTLPPDPQEPRRKKKRSCC